MSGYADYKSIKVDKYPIHKVPVIRATAENFHEYGNFVQDYDQEKVMITPWPVSGHRPLMTGTGDQGGIAEGKFQYWREDRYMRAKSFAVQGDYITGLIMTNENQTESTNITVLNREANYHPDGGQVFYPIDKSPFILLLALPTDDIKPEDFTGFYFNGSQGCQIKANVWHQPAYPIEEKANFMTKQGKVHACVGVDTIDEFGCWLGIELKEPL